MLIDTAQAKNSNTNLFQSCALEIAIGSSLPVTVADWPTGLVSTWNDLSESGAFEGTKTIGDMARVYLNDRLEKL